MLNLELASVSLAGIHIHPGNRRRPLLLRYIVQIIYIVVKGLEGLKKELSIWFYSSGWEFETDEKKDFNWLIDDDQYSKLIIYYFAYICVRANFCENEIQRVWKTYIRLIYWLFIIIIIIHRSLVCRLTITINSLVIIKARSKAKSVSNSTIDVSHVTQNNVFCIQNTEYRN